MKLQACKLAEGMAATDKHPRGLEETPCSRRYSCGGFERDHPVPCVSTHRHEEACATKIDRIQPLAYLLIRLEAANQQGDHLAGHHFATRACRGYRRGHPTPICGPVDAEIDCAEGEWVRLSILFIYSGFCFRSPDSGAVSGGVVLPFNNIS